MNCVIYVCDNIDISIFDQWNSCSQYCNRCGISIADKVLDFEGGNFYQAVDKAVFNDDIDSVVIYNQTCIGDFQDNIFFRIYLNKFDKQLIISN